MAKAIAGHDVAASEIAKVSEIAHLLDQDTTPWYRKKNLRRLYMFLIPSALGVEMTSGYDGSVLNGLQAVQPWQDCKTHMDSKRLLFANSLDFHTPNGALLGVMTAAFSIGAVLGLPLVPYINDRYGRKACIVLGSGIITVGAILQTASVNSKEVVVTGVCC